MSQNDAILEALKQGRKLTALDAFYEFGSIRLPSRIWDLKRKGYDIKSEMHQTDSGKHVSRYWIDPTPKGSNYKLF